MGLGSCWIQIRKRMHDEIRSAEAYVSEILNIPKIYAVESMIAIGYPDEKKPSHRKEDLQYEKVYRDIYGKAYGH